MTCARHWAVADLPWERFDRSLVDQNILKLVKAAALVEYNAGDYATYLSNIFGGDPDFCEKISRWAREETQHGEALGAWAKRADPSFDFESAFARYKAGYHINAETHTSIRGSKTGELIARCVVEAGTSSYYTALGEATAEPVLKSLCRSISADEFRHYKMFYSYLECSLDCEKQSRFERLKIGLGRVEESEDDELAFAYFAANTPAGSIFNRPLYTSKYMMRAYPLYRRDNLGHMITLIARACGFRISRLWRGPVGYAATLWLKTKLLRAHHLHRQLVQP
jgi:tRNA isopentenyl-2-thiomethyl-A-37 hydroxylase MiaE